MEKWITSNRPFSDYPLGTKAKAINGGYWMKVSRGWKWCTGAIFSAPGGDWTGEVSYPPYRFWRENLIAKEYALTVDEVAEAFESYLLDRDTPIEWMDAYGLRFGLMAFISSKEGLRSAFEDDRLEELEEQLDQIWESVWKAKKYLST